MTILSDTIRLLNGGIMAILRIIVAALLGLVGAGLVYQHAAQAPASYIGNFTAPWFTQAALFFVVIIPPALAFSKLHRVMGMRRVVFFIGIIVWLGAFIGIYVAGRWVYESQGTVVDWLMVIFGTLLLVGSAGYLTYLGLQDQTV